MPRVTSKTHSPLLALLALSLLGSAARPADPSLPAQLLQLQNDARAAVDVPPLRWSDDLARSADQWAQYLATTGELRHAPPNLAGGQGENIWAGTHGAFSNAEMVDAWIAEKQDFKPGAFPNNSLSNDWHHVGHYTQLVWRQSREVGCAIASSQERDILVCRYRSPGNVIGQRPF